MRTQVAMTMARGTIAALLAALALAGCSGSFGGSKRNQPDVVVDSNLYPSNYRAQIATMLATVLTNRAEFVGTLIAPPALKPVADSQNLHYVVCLQFAGSPEHNTKVMIYLGGTPTQYVDATPEQCAGAAYQPFTELQAELPHK